MAWPSATGTVRPGGALSGNSRWCSGAGDTAASSGEPCCTDATGVTVDVSLPEAALDRRDGKRGAGNGALIADAAAVSAMTTAKPGQGVGGNGRDNDRSSARPTAHSTSGIASVRMRMPPRLAGRCCWSRGSDTGTGTAIQKCKGEPERWQRHGSSGHPVHGRGLPHPCADICAVRDTRARDRQPSPSPLGRPSTRREEWELGKVGSRLLRHDSRTLRPG